MVIIAVDDEWMALEHAVSVICAAAPGAEVHAFRNAEAAMRYAKAHVIHVAFLDIHMPKVGGLELAQQLKAQFPEINLIFATGYTRYMPEAFRLRASGYLLKPLGEESVQEELENLRNPVLASLRQAPIYVQTFGNFEIFVHGKAVHFSRKKAKECLAYLIDRNGANVETAELSAILWDASENSHSLQKQVQTVISCMLRALREAGAEEIIRKNWGSMAIDVALVECDYYHLLHGDAAAVQALSGEYMTNYRWAEGTAGFLYETYAHESVRA